MTSNSNPIPKQSREINEARVSYVSSIVIEVPFPKRKEMKVRTTKRGRKEGKMIILWKIGLKTFGKAASVKPVWKVHIDSQRCNLSNFPCLIENFRFISWIFFCSHLLWVIIQISGLCTIVWPCPKCTAFLQCNFLNYGLGALLLMILNYNSSRVSKYIFPFVIM